MTELWLKIKDHEGQDQRIQVDRDAFTIGRHSSNDLCIPNSKLSREHVKIERIGADFFVSDSGSTNGTKINGKDLKGETKLQVGDSLDLGGGVLAEVVSGYADAMEAGESDGDSTEDTDLSNSVDSTDNVPSGGVAPTPGPALAPGGDGGIPTSIFYIAPILGVFILILLGGLIFFAASGDPSKPSSNDFVYTGNGDSGTDRPSKTGSDDPPSNVTKSGKTPEDVPPSNSSPTDNSDPVPTPATKDPTTDSGKCEQAGAAFLRRIAQNDPKAFLTGEQAQIVSGKVKQIGSSSALADNINSARRSSAQIKALALSKNLKPQFLATAALAKLGTTRGDALQAAQEMADTLDKLGTQIGSELANDSLLMIAAYDQGAGGDFMKMRNMLQDLATKSPDSARAIRTIWFLHKNGKITDGEYDFALRFLAIGTIMQNPKDFGVNAEALSL